MSIDDYRVLRELGGGGFGKAYLVEARKVNGKPKRVLKHLQVSEVRSQKEWEIFVRLFKKEAKILGLLGQHPQIPSLYEYIYQYGNFFLVQEYVKGCLLSREIQTGNKLSEAKVLYLIEEILVILKFVHDQGAIHLDLKPDNIIRRTSDGKLVLIDFGGAKQTSALQITPGGGTKSTDCVGTKGYMPAEQAMGRPKPASDIYAVGKIGIQALTGIHPYRIPEDTRTGKILWEDLVDGVSKDLTDLLNKMTQYHFSERYHDASDALKAVQYLKNKNLNFNFQPFEPNFMLQSQVPITPIQPKPINPMPAPTSPSPGKYGGNVPKGNPGINVQPNVPPKQQSGKNRAKEDDGFRVMMFFLIIGFYGASGFVHTAMNAPLWVSGSFIASITTSIIYSSFSISKYVERGSVTIDLANIVLILVGCFSTIIYIFGMCSVLGMIMNNIWGLIWIVIPFLCLTSIGGIHEIVTSPNKICDTGGLVGFIILSILAGVIFGYVFKQIFGI